MNSRSNLNFKEMLDTFLLYEKVNFLSSFFLFQHTISLLFPFFYRSEDQKKKRKGKKDELYIDQYGAITASWFDLSFRDISANRQEKNQTLSYDKTSTRTSVLAQLIIKYRNCLKQCNNQS